MHFSKRKLGVLAVVLLTFSALALAERPVSKSYGPAIISWQPPATYTPSRTGSGLHPLGIEAEIGGGPFPFFPITPCRQYDSRSFTPLLQNTPRTITLSGAPCGINGASLAIAVNITVFNIFGATGNAVFLVGTASPPTTAWINYPPSETQRGNAGVVPTNGSGQIVVEVEQGGGQIDFTVDVYGYYYNGNFTMMPTGDFFSIWGNYSGGSVLFGRNDQASAAGSYGTRGWAFSTGAGSAGVSGEEYATSGAVSGVHGLSSSTSGGAVGVHGIDATGAPTSGFGITAGGLFESKTGGGAYGLSRYVGVGGQLYNNTGGFIAEGLLGSTFGTAADTTTGPWGVFSNGNFGASGAKHFVEPHPTDAKKVILYSSLEGREVGTYFRGTGQIVNHVAVINIPEDFRTVTDAEGLTVQITPIGGFAQVYIESEDLNQIVIKGSRDVQFHYMVNGVRKAFRDFQPVQIGYEFMPKSASATMPAYLTDEAKARLISNGTYNADGTVNMTTAERVGFTKVWADRDAATKAAAEQTAAERASANRQDH